MIKLTTNFGDITLELDREKAPETTQNFLDYVQDGFYDNTIFHRVIDDFMIQGGGFEPGMKQKKTKPPIQNEAANGLKNDTYTIAMASFILAEAGLSFLGLGVPTGIPTWGNILNAAKDLEILTKNPWLWIPPGVAICLFVLGVNFIGDGLRDVLDPRQ